MARTRWLCPRVGVGPAPLGYGAGRPASRGQGPGRLAVEPLEERTLLSGSTPLNFTAVNGALFFTTEDPAYGAELWRSDGTQAGTTLVSVVAPAGVDLSHSVVAFDGSLFFTPSDPDRAGELWKSDGTAGGTVLVKDVVPGSAGNRYWPT
jgi:ELWxxDGT repeat protein